MNVHNVYSDNLFYLSHVVNKILLNKITSFQFNIANASLTLDYIPNYTLPNAIINFTNVSPLNIRMAAFHSTLANNVHLIPVLYNRTKDLTLYLQEDLYYFDCEVNINAESQLHAIDIKHKIENSLPVGKFLDFSNFTSFYKIDDIFLNKFLFDVHNDDICNLFLLYDKITNETKYSFGVNYEPLIRLESINLNINDITSSTFTVNTSFRLLTHLPNSIVFDKNLLKDFNSVHLLRKDNILVPLNKIGYLLNNQKLIFDNDENFTITKDIKYIEFGEFYTLENIRGDIEIHHYENNNFGIKLIFDNKISILKNPKFKENNTISGFLDEEVLIIYNITKNNQKITINSTSNDYLVKYYDIIYPNEIYSAIKKVNKYKTEINYTETKILGYDEIIFETPLSLNENGEFYSNLISGEIDLKTGKVTVLNEDINILKLNIVFTVFEIRGSGYIETINLDIGSTFSNPISTVSVFDINKEYDEKYKNVIINKINLINQTEDFIEFGFYSKLDFENKFYYFFFTKNNLRISSETNYMIYKETINNQSIFTTSIKFFYEYLENINDIYPLCINLRNS